MKKFSGINVLRLYFKVFVAILTFFSLAFTAYADNSENVLSDNDYFYVPAQLFNYKYDNEIDESYVYWDGKNIKGGARYSPSYQVPFESFNREMSDFYLENPLLSNSPALYFGCFDGRAKRTYDSNNKAEEYCNVYPNFWYHAHNGPAIRGGSCAVAGLLDNVLAIDETGKENIAQNGVVIPLFNEAYANNSESMDVFKVENGFPFEVNNVNGVPVFSYDSASDGNRYYDKDSGLFTVCDKNSVKIYNETKSQTGFFPFNNRSYKITSQGEDRSDLIYGFGLRLDIPFNLTTGGQIVDNDGNAVDITFDFQGDDDVWVFVDGVLFLDIGGAHAKTGGNINFAKQTIVNDAFITFNSSLGKGTVVNSGGTFNKTYSFEEVFVNAGQQFDSKKFFSSDTQHTMSIFYMERGMYESNLQISFNMNVSHSLTVSEKNDFGGVNPGLLEQTKKISDNDVFGYTLANKGTASKYLPGSDISTPTYSYIERRNNYGEEPEEAIVTLLSGQENIGQGSSVNDFIPEEYMISGGDLDGFSYVTNVSYQLTDPYAVQKYSDEETDLRISNNTGRDGLLNLMYDQAAYFSGQFIRNSNMYVRQNQNLFTPQKTEGNPVSFEEGRRAVSDYYDTLVKVEDKSGELIYNTGDYLKKGGIYAFADEKGSVIIELEQTFINSVKTCDLSVSKQIKYNELSDESFPFKLTLNNLFGIDGERVDDYGKIEAVIDGQTVKLSKDGVFKIKANQTAVIKGVPVGTEYSVEELSGELPGIFETEYVSDNCMGTVSEESDLNVVVTNRRKVGALDLRKKVFIGNSVTETPDYPVTFSFTVELEAPNGVNLKNYLSDEWTCSDDGKTASALFGVSPGNKVIIDGIPCGVKYSVKEESCAGFVKINEENTTGAINADSVQTAVISNEKMTELPKTGGCGYIGGFVIGIGLIAVSLCLIRKNKTKCTSIYL